MDPSTETKKRYIPKVKRHEDALQVRIANYIKRRWPHVIFISDPAGIFFKEFDYNKELPKKLKAINSDRGRTDMTILYPSRGYHGLCIELKPDGAVIKNKDGTLRKQLVTRKVRTAYGIRYVRYDHLKEQAEKLQLLNDLGFFARFGIGFDKTTKILDWYFGEDDQTIF